MCPDTVGPARAIVRPRPSGGAIPVIAADAALELPRHEPDAALERRYEGPLDLDLGRILLLHRVEDIPPPPEFIFRPFVSSRRAEADAEPRAETETDALEAAAWVVGVPAPIEPRPCRVVDEREACRRVDRGWRVDVAPCVNVGAGGEPGRARVRRRSIASVHVLPASAPAATPPELEAVSA